MLGANGSNKSVVAHGRQSAPFLDVEGQDTDICYYSADQKRIVCSPPFFPSISIYPVRAHSVFSRYSVRPRVTTATTCEISAAYTRLLVFEVQLPCAKYGFPMKDSQPEGERDVQALGFVF